MKLSITARAVLRYLENNSTGQTRANNGRFYRHVDPLHISKKLRLYFPTSVNKQACLKRCLQELKDRGAIVIHPNYSFFVCITGEGWDFLNKSKLKISKQIFSMNEVAKLLNLGIGRNQIFALLRAWNIVKENNKPYEEYFQAGWFAELETQYWYGSSVKSIVKTVVTQEGVKAIRNLIWHARSARRR